MNRSETHQSLEDAATDTTVSTPQRAQEEAPEDAWGLEHNSADPDEETFREAQAELGLPQPRSHQHDIVIPGYAPQEFVKLARLLQKKSEQMTLVAEIPEGIRDNLYLKFLLANLTEFINVATSTRRKLTVQFVEEGNISRVDAGKLLGVHQSTIAQWVKEDTQEAMKPIRADTPDPRDR